MNAQSALSRRGFIGATLAVGGSVLFYMRVSGALEAASPGPILLDGWIRIAPDGAVTVFSRTTELGQGALTTLALIVSEELRLDAATVSVEMAPVTDDFVAKTPSGAVYYATWGSDSSRDMDRRMRKVAATARILLLQAAAAKCARGRMQRGQWRRAPRGRPYGNLRGFGTAGCGAARAAKRRTHAARKLETVRQRGASCRYSREDRW
jgi:CO/xanthine dehydrogenase Mo-binding subunit